VRVALIRHSAPLIAPGICYGRLDVAVDPSADEQTLSKLISDPGLHGAQRVWTSPAIRCRSLADAIARSLSASLSVDNRLWELDFGAWEGQAWGTIDRAELDRWAASVPTFAPPGGESGANLIERIRNFHADVCRDQQDCVVVSHGGPLKVLHALMVGGPIDLAAPAPAIGSVTNVLVRSFDRKNQGVGRAR
jgi:alpha-ribazole phosphatase